MHLWIGWTTIASYQWRSLIIVGLIRVWLVWLVSHRRIRHSIGRPRDTRDTGALRIAGLTTLARLPNGWFTQFRWLISTEGDWKTWLVVSRESTPGYLCRPFHSGVVTGVAAYYWVCDATAFTIIPIRSVTRSRHISQSEPKQFLWWWVCTGLMHCTPLRRS